MENKYVIINAEAIQKRIEELEKANEVFKHAKTHNPTMAACEATLSTLKQILSQSTPLISEIEKAFEAGSDYGEDCANSSLGVGEDYPNKQDYISNLKLDI